MQGDATDEDLLEQENIAAMDVFCALTNDDEDNIMSALLAKRMGAHRVIALINRSAYVDLVQGGEIDIAISPAQATVGTLLSKIRRGDMVAVHSLRRGAAEVLEVVVHGDAKTSRVVGRRIEEIDLPEGATIARHHPQQRRHHRPPRHPDRGRGSPHPVRAQQAHHSQSGKTAPGRIRVLLMSRIAPVLNVLSKVVMLFSATFLLPLSLSWILDDGAQRAYDEAIFITFVAGALTWLFTRKAQRELQTRDGFLLVVLAWTSLPAFATLPLLLYLPELSFTDAYFETVSGITTTGSTILSGLDTLPHVDQSVARPAGVAGRHGLDRAGGGHPAAAGRGRACRSTRPRRRGR